MSQTLQAGGGIGDPRTLSEYQKALGTGVTSSHSECKVMKGSELNAEEVDGPIFLGVRCT